MAAPASTPTPPTPAALILERCTEAAKDLEATPSPLPDNFLLTLATAVDTLRSLLPPAPAAEAAPAETSREQAKVPLPMPKREVPTAVPDEEDGLWLSTPAKAAPDETSRVPTAVPDEEDIPDLAWSRCQENAEPAPDETRRQEKKEVRFETTAVPDEEVGHWVFTSTWAKAETRRLPVTSELVYEIPDLAETRVQENAEAAPSETMRQQNAGASSEEAEASSDY